MRVYIGIIGRHRTCSFASGRHVFGFCVTLLYYPFLFFLITSPHTVLLLTSKYDGMARALAGGMNGGSFGVESVHLLIFFSLYFLFSVF